MIRAALLGCCVLLPLSARAGAIDEAYTYLQAGDPATALGAIDQALAGQAGNTQLRFVRGLALARLGRRDEAIAVYADLVRDLPASPEPYNNLAVLLVEKGDYARARAVLEVAGSKAPEHRLTQANLGDVYVALARQSYARAVAGESTPAPALALKLQVLQTLR